MSPCKTPVPSFSIFFLDVCSNFWMLLLNNHNVSMQNGCALWTKSFPKFSNIILLKRIFGLLLNLITSSFYHPGIQTGRKRHILGISHTPQNMHVSDTRLKLSFVVAQLSSISFKGQIFQPKLVMKFKILFYALLHIASKFRNLHATSSLYLSTQPLVFCLRRIKFCIVAASMWIKSHLRVIGSGIFCY